MASTQRNICTADRITRIALGVVFITLGIVATPWINFLKLASTAWYLQSILAILIGVFFIRAGITKCCPINKVLGISTARKTGR